MAKFVYSARFRDNAADPDDQDRNRRMSKSLSFEQAIVATAKQKRDVAKRRSVSKTAEKPRDVIVRACEEIAEKLAGDGFSFVKSGMQLKRVQGGPVHIILFQSDRNNIPGTRAAVWIHAGVQSRGSRTFIEGGQIGSLLPETTWMEWNFADVSARQAEIDDALVRSGVSSCRSSRSSRSEADVPE